METKWAVENLQTIRTLMERSAVYRRALAPIMIFTGTAGIVGGLAGWLCRIEGDSGFVLLWLGVALIAAAGSLLLVRRQALKDSEPFWSPPTRRVGQALLPAFFTGLMVAVFVAFQHGSPGARSEGLQGWVILLWIWLYGCAVHAAGFFMPRGVRWLGWMFILIGSGMLVVFGTSGNLSGRVSPHLLMGGIFGGLHLAYGIYLYFTEKKNPVA